MKEYSLFIGCTIPVRAMNYELSARKVLDFLKIPYRDVEEFTCCGYPLESVDELSSLTASAKNLALAEKYGTNVMTLCSACTGTLTKAKKILDENDEILEEVNEQLKVLDLKYERKAEVHHIIRVIMAEIGLDKLKEIVKRPLTGIRIAPHYGCHYSKPTSIFGDLDDPEYPTSIKRVVEALGGTYVEYENLMQCCGGAVMGVDEKLALKLAGKKLEHISDAGADAITLVCPFCYIMYETNQRRIERDLEKKFGIPVAFLTQLIGLALGIDSVDLGFKINRVRPKDLLAKIESA
ncbi:MAG: CoB--CoM heterodisulfide reductase iron-sulfur subunit B family protein [Promethearchaeota archaeon]